MLDDIVLFIQLYEFRSFKKCADFLNIKSSTISKHIINLETELGNRLIIRDTKNFEPTDFGNYIYNKFKHIPSFMDETLAVYQKDTTELRHPATINLALGSVLSHGLICPQLDRFLTKHPEIKLNIIFRPNMVNLPDKNTSLVLSTKMFKGEGVQNRFIRTEYGKLFCSSNYAMNHELPQHPSELNYSKVIGVVDLHNIGLNYLKFKNISTKEEYLADMSVSQLRLDNALHMLQTGINSDYIFGSFEYQIRDLLKQGMVVPVFPNWVVYEVNYYLISKGTISTEEQLVIDFIQECLNV